MSGWLGEIDVALGSMDFSDFEPFTDDCDHERLHRVTAGSYYQWLLTQSLTREGSDSSRLDECDLIYVPSTSDNEEDGRGMGILFPTDGGNNIDEWMNWFREKDEGRNLPLTCWVTDKEDMKTTCKLLSRGFSSTFVCNWLQLDMKETPLDYDSIRIEDGVTFRVINPSKEGNIWESTGFHPCYKDSIEKIQQMNEACTLSNGQLVIFAAFLEGIPIASATLFLGKGNDFGVAGLFEVEVIREHRGKGIGKAISFSTCYYAKKAGYRYILGNASDQGVPMYYRLQFSDYGRGLVYLLSSDLLHNPVGEGEKVFIEAIGSGDDKLLGKYHKAFKNTTRLSNGMSPIQLALYLGKVSISSWLHSHGHILDIMSAWEMGWRDEITLLIKERKSLIEWRRGEHGLTPLHEAAKENNIRLARLILQEKPNLDIVDTTFGGTPLDWAEQCGSEEVSKAIQKCQSKPTKKAKKKKGKKKK